MYVYRRTDTFVWTVGFYAPDGTWFPEPDPKRTQVYKYYESPGEAADRVHYLNGGSVPTRTEWEYVSTFIELEKGRVWKYWDDKPDWCSLSDIGAEGWELVTVIQEEEFFALFKRPITEEKAWA